jgi:hypothetical protein
MKQKLILAFLLSGSVQAADPSTYGGDLDFLRQHTKVIELRNGEAAVAIAPAYQGRVMTSTATGNSGYSFGWLNYKVIQQGVLTPDQAKGKLEEHIYVFGGEERFWLGPEGGQFGIFFPKGAAFDFASWKTPAPLDTEPFDVVSSTPISAVFAKSFQVSNQSGTQFKVEVERKIGLLGATEIEQLLGKEAAGAKVVAYATLNTLINRGDQAWTKDTGLLSIWLLGMYKPSPGTVMAIPVRDGEASALGPQVNDDYFGKVPADRLKVKDNVIFFKGDGTFRSKIGVPPKRALGVAGSYCAEEKALTLTMYYPDGSDYVNSAWAIQEKPFGGDATNAYNDGSPEPGKPPLGPFYELESSSPAAALKPGGQIVHRQVTFHLTGSAAVLDAVAKKHLHATTAEISGAFAK